MTRNPTVSDGHGAGARDRRAAGSRPRDGQQAPGGTGPTCDVAVISGDPWIHEHLRRLAASVGTLLTQHNSPHALAAVWPQAAAVVVGADLAPSLARAGLPRRDDLLIVAPPVRDAGGRTCGADGRGQDSLWRDAVALGAVAVLELPDDDTRLVETLGRAGEPPARAAALLAVLGGHGGAGASYLAVAIARTAARRRMATLLLDGDPHGGGIDLALGAGDAPGLRWPDLVAARGRLPAAAVVDGLPRRGDLRVLAWDRAEPATLPAAAMTAVLGAGRRAVELVVADLPRSVDDPVRVVLRAATTTLLVVAGESRACAAAGRVRHVIAPYCTDLQVVVRRGGGLTPQAVAETLDLPLAGILRPGRRFAAALDRGDAGTARLPRSARRLAQRVLDTAEDHPAGPA